MQSEETPLCFALLCGSAPKGWRQKKLEHKYDFLVNSQECGCYKPDTIVVFPNGVNELFLESLLNEAFEKTSNESDDGAMGKVLLYLCARDQVDLNAELSDCDVPGVEVVRLGEEELRKDVLAYYAELAEKMGVGFQVEYDWDGELINEDELGYAKVV